MNSVVKLFSQIYQIGQVDYTLSIGIALSSRLFFADTTDEHVSADRQRLTRLGDKGHRHIV